MELCTVGLTPWRRGKSLNIIFLYTYKPQWVFRVAQLIWKGFPQFATTVAGQNMLTIWICFLLYSSTGLSGKSQKYLHFFSFTFWKFTALAQSRNITESLHWNSTQSHPDVFVLHLLENFVFNAQTLLYENRKRTTKSFQFQFSMISEWFTLTNDRAVFCPPS